MLYQTYYPSELPSGRLKSIIANEWFTTPTNNDNFFSGNSGNFKKKHNMPSDKTSRSKRSKGSPSGQWSLLVTLAAVIHHITTIKSCANVLLFPG